jgi:hypothetical protein
MAFPGQVTSNIVGSTFQAMSPTAEAYMYKEMDRKREEQERRNEEIKARHDAENAARQQAAQDAENQARVKAAFDQMYGPQIQQAYQDNAVWSAPTNTPAGKARDWAIGHGYTSGGTVGQPNTSITERAQGALPKPQLSQQEISGTLNNMWRMSADPYQRVAMKLGGPMMPTMYPSSAPAEQWGAAKGRSPVGRSGGTSKKKKQSGPEGLDWWYQQNRGGQQNSGDGYEPMQRG